MRAEFGGRAEIAPINRKCERGTTTLKCDLSGKPLKFGGGKCGVKTKGLSAKAKTVIQAGDAMRTGAAYYHGENLSKLGNARPEKTNNRSFYFLRKDAIKFAGLAVTRRRIRASRVKYS